MDICQDPRHTLETKFRIIEKYAKPSDINTAIDAAIRRTHLTVADIAMIDLDHHLYSLRWNKWITRDVFEAIRQRFECKGNLSVSLLYGSTVFVMTGALGFIPSYFHDGNFALPHVADLEPAHGRFLKSGHKIIHVINNQSYMTYKELASYIDKHCGKDAYQLYSRLERDYYLNNPFVDPVERIRYFAVPGRHRSPRDIYDNCINGLTHREYEQVSDILDKSIVPLIAPAEWWNRHPNLAKSPNGRIPAHIAKNIVDHNGYLYAREWPEIGVDVLTKTNKYIKACERIYRHYVKIYAFEIAETWHRKSAIPGGLHYYAGMYT